MKRAFNILLPLLLLASCTDYSNDVIAPPPKTLRLSPRSPNITPGQSFVFTVDSAGGVGTIIWKSGDASVVSVDSLGKVLGLSGGTAMVTATSSTRPQVADSVPVVVVVVVR